MALGLSGCSTLSGVVGEGPAKEAYGDLDLAIGHAQTVLDAIDEKQEGLDEVSTLTTAGLYGAGTGAGIAGVYGASSDLVTGFAAAAGGILGIVDLAQVAQKWAILEHGKEAIFCSMEQTAALSFARKLLLGEPSGNEEFGVQGESRIGASSMTARLTSQFTTPDASVEAMLSLAEGQQRPSIQQVEEIRATSMLIGALQQSRASIERSAILVDAAATSIPDEVLADTLTRTVERIRAEIEKQMRATVPDPTKVFENQRATIGSTVGSMRQNVVDTKGSAEESLRFARNAEMLSGSAMLTTAGFNAANIDTEAISTLEAVKKKLDEVANCLKTVTLGTPVNTNPSGDSGES